MSRVERRKEIKFIDPNIARKEQIVEHHRIEKADIKLPPLSVVEFNLTGLCNRSCIFCPHYDPEIYPNVNEFITLELYEKVMKGLQEIGFDGTILYSAFCEPLLHKRIEQLIRLSKEYCSDARIEIVTNGDFVTAEKLRKLFKAGLSTLCISMYDGPHQVEPFRAMQKEVGLTDDQFILRVRYLPREEHYGITLSNRAGMLTMEDIGIAPLREPLRQRCNYPFYEMMVDYDGSIPLCPHDWGKRLVVGDLNHQSVHEVWNSPLMKQARMNLAADNRDFPPCDTCDVDGTLIGQGHFEQWLEHYRSEQSDER